MECLFTFGYLIWIDKDIQYKIEYFFMQSRDLIPEYIHISLPVVVSDGMMALGNSIVMVIIGHMGGEYVAAYAVVAIVERLCTAWSSGVAHTSSVIIGNTLGEGKKESAIRQGWSFLGLGILLGVIAAMIVLLIRRPMILLYHLSSRTANIAGQLLMASVFIVIFQAIGSILTKGVLRGGGDTKVLMFVDNIFLWMCSIPFGYFLGNIIKCPVFWVYNALSIHHFMKSIWCIFRMHSDKWIHKIKSV